MIAELKPYPAMKDSSVEWLGEVPEHWEVVQSGHLINLLTGFPFKSEGFSKLEEDIRLLRGVNVTPCSLRWEGVVRWPSQQREEFEAFQLEIEDSILGMDQPIIAAAIRVTQVPDHDLPCLLVQRVARIRPRPGTDARFLLHLYAGKGFSDYLSPIFTGVSVPHLSPEQICSLRVAMAPIEEQEALVEHLNVATENIDTTITRTNREIELLNEYRPRLIADVVTGNLDVRDAATALPKVDPLAEDDNADNLDADLDMDAGELDETPEEVEL